jgi:hypothetical protein
VTVGLQQAFRAQIAADGEQALGRGLSDRREAQITGIGA